MGFRLYLPPDRFSGLKRPDLDLAADYLELKAACSRNGQSQSQDIVDALEIAADDDYPHVEGELKVRETVAADTMVRILSRKTALRGTYPYDISEQGDSVIFTAEQPDFGQAAYLVSLLLSNLRSVSQLLEYFDGYPTDPEIDMLRRHFQYIATAAVAGEIGGRAWSFGFPRPDGSGFIPKLDEIWTVLKDGSIRADDSAPNMPKDDGVDVFACREPTDGLPGFLLVAAQVATGKNWKDKTIHAHINSRFLHRWFDRLPVTRMIPYHVIPFARPDEAFRDDVDTVGNLLHRLRVPCRVMEAKDLVDSGITIEAFDQISVAADWIESFIKRVRRQ